MFASLYFVITLLNVVLAGANIVLFYYNTGCASVMKALRFIDKTLEMDDVPIPAAEGEALVRVLQSGICNTDVEIVRGYNNFSGTIGHEFVGVVEEAADAPELVGKRVVGEINAGCGECSRCREGDSRHCPNRTVLGIDRRDGAHAEYLRLPSRNLCIVPENVTNDQAIFTEPLAAAYGIIEQVTLDDNMRVAVIGDGKLGLLCALSLAPQSKNISIIGKHKEKLAVAEAHNVKGILLEDVDESLNREFDVVIESSGSEAGFATALNLLKPRGKMVLKSTFHGNACVEMWRVVVDEITIVGSRCGRFAPALELLAQGNIKVETMISAEYPLEKGVEAMQKATEKGVLKVVLKM